MKWRLKQVWMLLLLAEVSAQKMELQERTLKKCEAKMKKTTTKVPELLPGPTSKKEPAAETGLVPGPATMSEMRLQLRWR